MLLNPFLKVGFSGWLLGQDFRSAQKLRFVIIPGASIEALVHAVVPALRILMLQGLAQLLRSSITLDDNLWQFEEVLLALGLLLDLLITLIH